jgi:hypothetical protein
VLLSGRQVRTNLSQLGLHYDVRRYDASTEPVLLLIGSPMGAVEFGTLAGHFADRAVVTYHPGGAGRSKRTDGASSPHNMAPITRAGGERRPGSPPG